MKVTINDKEVNFPSSLAEITLGQRIEFQHQYGDDLDKMIDSILKMPDDAEREIEMMQFHFEKMFRTFAFFAGTTVDAVKESQFINEVAGIYNTCLSILFQEQKNMELQREFIIWGEKWVLAAPELKHGDKMKFGEVIASKQIVKDMADLGRGRWDAFIPLCAIYLRPEGEDYDESFMYENSERQKLMETLPLDVALQVGFFLSDSMNFYIAHSMSLGSHGQSQMAII